MAETSLNDDHGQKFNPDLKLEEAFNFPYLTDEKTIEFIKSHGRIMFILRGLPGSGKGVLSSLIKKKMESSVTCSADANFEKKFKIRNKQTMRMSHMLCVQQVKNACQTDASCIIVENSHVKRWEMAPYIELANKHGYTLIMAITLRKIAADPKVLAKTNRKGIQEDYLLNRLRAWEEYYPMFLGWFLSPNDACVLRNQAKTCLLSLLNDGKFCRVFDSFSQDDIGKYFDLEPRCFCISYHCKVSEFYLSDTIQDVYGKTFTLTIIGFLVTKKHIVALVKPTDATLALDFKSSIESLSISKSLDTVATMPKLRYDQEEDNFNSEFDTTSKTTEFIEWAEDESFDIESLHVIPLGYCGTETAEISNPEKFLNDTISGITTDEGKISGDEFSESEDGTLYCRLEKDAWLVKSRKKIQIETVFTGLYL